MTAAAYVLAHQGGWDEILLVLTPVSLFAALLWLANRRANAQIATRRVDPARPADDDDDDGTTSAAADDPHDPPIGPDPQG